MIGFHGLDGFVEPEWALLKSVLPEPLTADEMDLLREVLHSNGDSDDAGAFMVRVLDVLAAYDRIYYRV